VLATACIRRTTFSERLSREMTGTVEILSAASEYHRERKPYYGMLEV
jgi:hypothetical protein